ncbi:hypothetical protein CEK71_16700 [Methylovulum psychrotolerans]|uniref:Uncharacterized protein n=1 Tax=Methylovulum psychrotolerans TaxID=1704499 RepID=A0A1Z4C230_9GAMM|nr:hypothetical protein CEK71_16700 [Methylovulum psychrotolerans]
MLNETKKYPPKPSNARKTKAYFCLYLKIPGNACRYPIWQENHLIYAPTSGGSGKIARSYPTPQPAPGFVDELFLNF